MTVTAKQLIEDPRYSKWSELNEEGRNLVLSKVNRKFGVEPVPQHRAIATPSIEPTKFERFKEFIGTPTIPLSKLTGIEEISPEVVKEEAKPIQAAFGVAKGGVE